MLFCGIDTSNYTTSAAVCDEGGRIIANLKRPLPVADGGCGLRQSDAVFAHIKNLPGLMQELSRVLAEQGGEVAACGVSEAPRTAEGSYMPCFLSGVAAAESFCARGGVPLLKFSHQQGHVKAAAFTSGAESEIRASGVKEYLAFHVSGGTTELLLVKDGAYPDITLIGGTQDLNAGQAIDRIGVALGMHFPCGPELERQALRFEGKIHGHAVSVNGLECCLSGLENLALGMKKQGKEGPEIAAFVFDYIGKTLEKLTSNARTRYGELPVVYAGGVMSNSIIKKRLSAAEKVWFAEPAFSADNAVGIALLCREKYLALHAAE